MNTEPLKHQPAAPLSTHLSEDDLNDALIGLTTPNQQAHLASCETCSAELAAFHESMGVFNKASLAWSEARSNSMPLQPEPRRSSRLAPIGTWAVSGVLAFVVAFFLTSAIHHHTDALEAKNPAAATESTREQEIASDNAMLAAINSELYSRVPSPLETYQPATSNTAARHSSPQVKN